MVMNHSIQRFFQDTIDCCNETVKTDSAHYFCLWSFLVSALFSQIFVQGVPI